MSTSIRPATASAGIPEAFHAILARMVSDTDYKFRNGTKTLSGALAAASAPLVGALLKIGLSSLEKVSPGCNEDMLKTKAEQENGYMDILPEFACAIDYAMDVSPRIKGESDVIDIPKALRYAEEMKRSVDFIFLPSSIPAMVARHGKAFTQLATISSSPPNTSTGHPG